MNEQQHLEEVIGRFLQNTRENEEISKEEAIYLKRRIRPAMEYLIVQENIDGMKKMADRGWFGEQELNGFLTRAGELKKWDAFRVLLAWKNHISTKEKSPNTATKQELLTGQTAAFVMAKTVFIYQEEVDVHALTCRPLLQQVALALQLSAFFVVQPGLVTNPDVEIGIGVLAHDTGARHL